VFLRLNRKTGLMKSPVFFIRLLLTRKQKRAHIVDTETIWGKALKNDFSHLLSSLVNALEEADAIYKKQADPILADYTLTEMHCVEKIGKIENPNVTKLATEMNITRGGISRLLKKIRKKGAVETYASDTNKKEVYYRLTPTGRKVFDAHEEIHENWRKYDESFFKKFTAEEIAFGIGFVEKYIKHVKRFKGG